MVSRMAGYLEEFRAATFSVSQIVKPGDPKRVLAPEAEGLHVCAEQAVSAALIVLCPAACRRPWLVERTFSRSHTRGELTGRDKPILARKARTLSLRC